jgi:hypothetical protein
MSFSSVVHIECGFPMHTLIVIELWAMAHVIIYTIYPINQLR